MARMARNSGDPLPYQVIIACSVLLYCVYIVTTWPGIHSLRQSLCCTVLCIFEAAAYLLNISSFISMLTDFSPRGSELERCALPVYPVCSVGRAIALDVTDFKSSNRS
ncbi:hypothetical protein F5Y12DRAFT_752230 [Xylaria sp. FL1777]|nr:hypothetical protein F5Y12DRAFT_752230 [Xylaria sp. FL1777]